LPNSIKGKYIWKEVNIGSTDTIKGAGLFASKDLPPNFCIPFGGVYRTRNEWYSITHHINTRTLFNRTSHSAEAVRSIGRKREKGVADAHPSNLVERQAPFNAWPGAYCNQADQPEAQNGILVQHDGRCNAPNYEWLDKRCKNLFVKLLHPVIAGEEILIDYGYSKHKQTRLGFGYDAKKQKVKSSYTLRKRKHDIKYGETQIVD
jgi:hypothetical protein